MPNQSAIAPRPKEPRPEPETTTVLRPFGGIFTIQLEFPAVDEKEARAKFLQMIRKELQDPDTVLIYER